MRIIKLALPSLIETLILVGVSSLVSAAFGLALGLVLVAVGKGGVEENGTIYFILTKIVDAIRSIPFIILLFFLFPVTKIIMGTSIGIKAALFPLIVAAIPFYARISEGALLGVPPGIREAAASIGAGSFDILKVMLHEAQVPLVRGLINLIINLIGYSAMAGAVGGGGLGDLAIRYGLHRYNFNIMVVTVVILYILVTLIQNIGDWYVAKLERK
ncbi:MAG: ABC transporter permease [Tissierellia bacterium]|nr:ABC transporter permease [Tissierellia bacterium]